MHNTGATYIIQRGRRGGTGAAYIIKGEGGEVQGFTYIKQGERCGLFRKGGKPPIQGYGGK